jgi:hypothetical protein
VFPAEEGIFIGEHSGMETDQLAEEYSVQIGLQLRTSMRNRDPKYILQDSKYKIPGYITRIIPRSTKNP